MVLGVLSFALIRYRANVTQMSSCLLMSRPSR